MTEFLPAVILVKPQLAENVGGAARVLHNFGFVDLRFVDPKLDFVLDQKAVVCACAGEGLLKSAKVYSNVTDAVADLHYLYAATARVCHIKRKCTPSTNLSIKIANSGILFGPENSGLSNKDMLLCDEVIHIDAKNNPLDLVHAIAVLAYQCYNKAGASFATERNSASKKELSFLYDTLGIMLERSGFFYRARKKRWRYGGFGCQFF